MSIEPRQNTRELWVQRKGRLSQEAFVEKYPYPFLLVGDVAVEASDDFFTHRVSVGSAVDAVESEDDEIIPLLKGSANPYSDRIILGRARNCDIVFRNPSVSKVHADLLVLGPDSCEVVDRGSTNGTCVRGARVAPREKTAVACGERVDFGTVRCVVTSSRELYRLL